jgi:hypothetical protein
MASRPRNANYHRAEAVATAKGSWKQGVRTVCIVEWTGGFTRFALTGCRCLGDFDGGSHFGEPTFFELK